MLQIISISFLAQAVMSMLLQKPDDARARPSSLLKREDNYKQIFSEGHDISLYLKCAQVLRKVEDCLKSIEGIDQRTRNNIKFHTAMYVTMIVPKKQKPTAEEISGLDMVLVTDEILKSSIDKIKKLFDDMGGTDQISKGPEFCYKVKELAIP